MMSCGPISYLAIGAVVLLAFVLVAAICAVALAHRDRMRALKREPLFDPAFPLASPDLVDRYRAAQK